MLQCQQEDARGCGKQGQREILDEDGKEGKSDDNKPIEIDMSLPKFKRRAGDFPTLKKKPRASPSSLSSEGTELSLLKREQMDKNENYRKMQFGLEHRKVELMEQAARLSIAKEQVQHKADILRQRAQLLREGVPQDEIDRSLPVSDHTDDN